MVGRNETQQQAISELLALPRDTPQRSRVLQLLVNWRITLEVTGELEQEEQSLMTTLSQAYLEWERATELRGELRGIEQGRQEGIKQEARALILRQLNRRIGELPEAVRLQIDGLSVAQLESLGEALLDFSNLSDLEAWLREQA